MNTEKVLDELAKINYKHYDTLTKEKVALMDKYLSLMNAGYTSYALSITYLPNLKSAKGHTTELIEKSFKKLYFHNFLRYYLFDGSKNWATKFNEYQPYIDVFEEAHEHPALHRPHLDEQVWKAYQYSDRLHHHAMVSVHPMHVEKMNALLGENTLNRFNKRAIMTSCVDVADIGWIGYIMKCQHKFAGTSLQFGPKDVDFPPCLELLTADTTKM